MFSYDAPRFIPAKAQIRLHQSPFITAVTRGGRMALRCQINGIPWSVAYWSRTDGIGDNWRGIFQIIHDHLTYGPLRNLGDW